jgi:hypothetical protein
MAEGQPSGIKQPEIDEFEIMRRRVQDQGQRRREVAQKAAKQQFARLGTLPSGAAIKAEQQAIQGAERETGIQQQDINIAQAQDIRQRQEAAAGRELQRFGITTQAETALKGIESQERIAERGEAGAFQRLSLAEQGLASRQTRALTSAQDIATMQGDLQREITGLEQSGASERQIADHIHQSNTQAIQNAATLEVLSETQAFQSAEAILNRDQQEALSQMDIDAQKNLAQMQIDFDKLALAQEFDHFKKSLAFQKLDARNKNNLIQVQNNLAVQAQAMKETMMNHAFEQDASELAINKAVTAINAMTSMRGAGFTPGEIKSAMGPLDLGTDDFDLDGFITAINGVEGEYNRLGIPIAAL